MKDYYSSRLQEISTKKKESIKKATLPLMRPEYHNETPVEKQTTMAGTPRKPNEGGQNNPELPQGRFKSAFDEYNKDPNFKTGMDELMGIFSVMREETKDLGLPPELLERRINGLLDQYQQQAMSASAQAPATEGAMGSTIPMQGQPVNPQGGM